MVLPVDENGQFGAIESVEFTSEARTLNGSGELDVEFKEATWVSVVFDVQLGENTSRAVWTSTSTPLASEEAILEALAAAAMRAGSIYESGEFVTKRSLTTYVDNVVYTYFAAMDEAGRLSNLFTFENELKDIVFDGTGTVAFEVDNAISTGATFELDFTLTPDDNVDYYYYRITNMYTANALSDEQLAVNFLTDSRYSANEGTLSTYSPKDNEPPVAADSYMLIMPVDKSGRLCKPIRYHIEETSAE